MPELYPIYAMLILARLWGKFKSSFFPFALIRQKHTELLHRLHAVVQRHTHVPTHTHTQTQADTNAVMHTYIHTCARKHMSMHLYKKTHPHTLHTH